MSQKVFSCPQVGGIDPLAGRHPSRAQILPWADPLAGRHPLGRRPTWADPPLAGRYPWADTPWTDTPLPDIPWMTPLGQTPPSWADTPPPGQTPPTPQTPPSEIATAADGTHPTGTHSCYNQAIDLPSNPTSLRNLFVGSLLSEWSIKSNIPLSRWFPEK